MGKDYRGLAEEGGAVSHDIPVKNTLKLFRILKASGQPPETCAWALASALAILLREDPTASQEKLADRLTVICQFFANEDPPLEPDDLN